MTVDPRYIEWGEKYSDGCTGVPEFHQPCCYEHDFHYQNGHDIEGQPLTRAEADRRFRRCIQSRSTFGWWSPMAAWRWVGVRLIGWRYWAKRKEKVNV